MKKFYRYRRLWPAVGSILLSLACGLGSEPATVLPERPADFDVEIVVTPTATGQTTIVQEVESSEPAAVAPLGDAPTHTPDPNALPTPTLLPTPTATLVVTETVATEPPIPATPTPEPAAPAVVAPTNPPPPPPVVELDPPLTGGDWDFEAGYIPWPNPFGEPCPGASVASGWSAFVEDGPYGSSCMNENLYRPNVFSGAKSQEITFDFISANSGVWRTIPTYPGHRYKIEAYAKNDRSISPVEMSLGVDLSGGTVWNAPSVQWFAWDNTAEDTWNATEETVTATGQTMTIFIRGFHPMAEQGGKTVIDNVTVTHLGP
jgi:hypothetical protein